jgi:hypothetical protein
LKYHFQIRALPVTVPEIPPVDSADVAVKIAIAAKAKGIS